ncbi:hypothetical protein [Vagococcus salmoninarum]|uniref:hypothetical protein n=1 Tax=Vagococcus salmoninarum TaxID=2739 RepID=UPI0028D2FC7B|nr:hypothetical protein [Vagococcus salmoninarum]
MAIYGYVQSNHPGKLLEQIKFLMTQKCDSVVIEDENDSSQTKLSDLITKIQAGDKLITVDVKVLNLNIESFIKFLSDLERRQATFVSVNDRFDSRLAYSLKDNLKLFNKLSALSKKSKEGKSEIKETGRPKIDESKIKEINYLYNDKKMNMRQIAEMCDVALGTVHKCLNK